MTENTSGNGGAPTPARVDTHTSAYDGQDAATLIRNADAAMYRAKQTKHSRIGLYSEELIDNIATFVCEDARDVAILRAILSLSRDLRLNTIIEGVETEAQKKLLLRLGCERAQGFLFHRPVPAQQLTQLLAPPAVRPEPAEAP